MSDLISDSLAAEGPGESPQPLCHGRGSSGVRPSPAPCKGMGSPFSPSLHPSVSPSPHIPLAPSPPAPAPNEATDPPAQRNARNEADFPVVSAGWPEEVGEGCVRLDPAAVLRATSRSFALRVHGQSMVGADVYDGDVVIGEFTPEARPGAIVVALIDGESTLKRLVMHEGRPYLASENPSCPNLIPLSELVIQGVVHTVIRGVR